MTNQEKKAWLRRYWDLDRAINQKLDEQERLRALCERVTPVLTGMPGGAASDRTDAYIKLAELEAQIDAEVDQYADMRSEIEGAIDTLDDMTLRTLMRYRYLSGLTWEEIAEKMGCELRWIYVLHGRALFGIVINNAL